MVGWATGWACPDGLRRHRAVGQKFSVEYLIHGGILYNLFGSLVVAWARGPPDADRAKRRTRVAHQAGWPRSAAWP